MGYTHYWRISDWNSNEWKEAWPQLVQDVPKIIERAGIPLTGPLGEGEPMIDLDKGVKLNGKIDHESFCLCKQPRNKFNFCKTARKPYDIVVACILLRAWNLAPNQVELSSDGIWSYDDEWVPVRKLYQEIWPGSPPEPMTCPWPEHE